MDAIFRKQPLSDVATGTLGQYIERSFWSDMMKKDIHPEYHEITVEMTDGTTFTTKSTWGEPGDTLKLGIDTKTHPAWTGVHRLVDSGGQLAKFNRRFKDFGIKG